MQCGSPKSFLRYRPEMAWVLGLGRKQTGALLVAAWLAAAILLGGCGYHVVGRDSKLPATWKTIAIPALVNKTSEYRVEQRFTQALIQEFLARTSYKIVQNEADADGILKGEVTSIETSPILFDATTGQVTTMLVTIHAKVVLSGRAENKVIYQNNDMVFRDEYQISGDIKSFFQEESPALQRMAHDFAGRVVANVLEGF
jgi:outer membrane lipopolysaccharide assembly protein LptE/RlpB